VRPDTGSRETGDAAAGSRCVARAATGVRRARRPDALGTAAARSGTVPVHIDATGDTIEFMGMTIAEVHELVDRRLREANQMYTKGRRELVELLIGFGRPATMPELIELRPKLTLSSMYRNMTDLESVGVVQKVTGADDRTRFELAEQVIGHHHHSICTQCGAVGDFVVPARAERTLEAALAKALSDSGFQPIGHRLDVLGICSSCA
jgi:Fe2+ or Zn2+ uptake regulation protein